ncbi:MAG: NAD(P)/FAD-dependent oxidoreductase [Solirubrobacterales bacterium]
MASTLILGGGFGGLATATALRERLPEEHEIVVVDARESFAMGLRKPWEIVGIGTLAAGSRARGTLDDRGINFVQGEISAIDPGQRTATVNGEPLSGDHLVVALGAQSRPDLVPGFEDHAHDAWDTSGIPALRTAFEQFDGGRIVVAVTGMPYTCPPAVYEIAMLIEEALRERELRDASEIFVSTPAPILLPVLGKEGSAALGEQLDARRIAHSVERKVERIEQHRVVYADGDQEFDLMIGAPPHRVPDVVADSGLTGDGGWVPVDRATLQTEAEGVFAIGDVTHIPIGDGLALPKAGGFAETEGEHVAALIAADVLGEPAPDPYGGEGFCFVEMGRNQAAFVEGSFFAEPGPSVGLRLPEGEQADEKRSWEAERLARWFGE